MCVQLEDYSQVRDSIKAYASGDVRIWIGTSYTTYGIYELIPKVGLPGASLWRAPPPALINLKLKWGHSPSAIQAVGWSTMVQEVPFLAPPTPPPREEAEEAEAGCLSAESSETVEAVRESSLVEQRL